MPLIHLAQARVSNLTNKEIDRIAGELNLSRSDIIRMAIERGLPAVKAIFEPAPFIQSVGRGRRVVAPEADIAAALLKGFKFPKAKLPKVK